MYARYRKNVLFSIRHFFTPFSASRFEAAGFFPDEEKKVFPALFFKWLSSE